ncbi:MAG TPA: DNA repair protein RecN [Bacteroidia bacterium]|jgi:DNA repair protein RecN (Recombination protein N)|nr:DNA repair protein RecN [Bacteroidia bacterium]
MLDQLTISNYALIDRLEVKFSKGLTLITGETGAGKSILLGALGLIVGQRADTNALQDKTKKCTVEAVFNLKGLKLEEFFKREGLDYEEESIVRREINPEGKSRAFINDTPVNLTVLKELGERLIDIHSQHQTLTLNDSGFQLSVVDTFACNEALLKEFETQYLTYHTLLDKKNKLQKKEADSKRDQDYFNFQFKELDDARLDNLQQEEMESELAVLNHSEEIKSGLGKAAFGLNGGDQNLIASFAELRNVIGNLSKYNASIAQLSDRMNSSYIELKDIVAEMESLEGFVVFDPARVTELEAQLDGLYKLLHKHHVKNVSELIAIRNDLSDKLLGISSLEAEIAAIDKELKSLHVQLLKKADELSARRKNAIPGVERDILKILNLLGMPSASLQIKSERLPDDQLGRTGLDRINFFFSANKGGAAKELNKVASGGELSRLMLSIKSLVARKIALPTVIFDEIDTGVSGDIADKVGSIMEEMGTDMQVITITHLPQIASKGKSHLFVYKDVKNNQTYTQIRALSKEERVNEIAKMLSAGQPTSAALSNAKELLNS